MDKIIKYFSFALPLLWIIGLDQILLYFVSASFFLFLALRQKPFNLPMLWLLFFILSSILSMFFITETIRYFEAFRNIIVYLILLSVIYHYRDSDESRLQFLLSQLLIFIFWVVISGYLGYIKPISFIAPLKNILPGSISNSSFLSGLFSNNLGSKYYTILGDMWRPSGIFTHSTTLAISLALSLPMIILYKNCYNKSILKRKFINILIFSIVVLIVLTTTRIALISLVFMFTYFLLKRKFYFSFLMVIFLIFSTLYLSYDFISAFRGGGSVSYRFQLYEKSFYYFLERPLFGWGAQMDIPGYEYLPALGSHSFYVNILFSTGIIGFLLLSLFFLSFIRHFNLRQSNSEVRVYINSSWIIFFTISITEVFHLDMLTVYVLMILTAITSINQNNRVIY